MGITKTFHGNFHSLEKLADFVAGEARKSGLDSKDIYDIQLAVDEAFTNIVEHAYGGESKGYVECFVESDSTAFKIILKDWGDYTFNPEDIPEPNFNLPLEKLQNRGAGVYLIKKIMDEVVYDQSEDDCNTCILIKRK